jgi:beta-lactamase regulating signal transducer with metallopeptidase domain
MILFNWIQDPSIRESLGWTVIHFLWIGSIVWLLAIGGRNSLRNASPVVRYWFSVACLLCMTILPIVIFGFVRGDAVRDSTMLPPPPTIDYMTGVLPGGAVPAITNSGASVSPVSDVGSGARDADIGLKIIRLLPFGWLAGIALYSAALMMGAVGVARLRQGAIRDVSDDLLEQLADLKERLAIVGEVLIGYSDRLVSPVLIGLTRPMILLPISAMSGVPREQLEMILLHELEHVRRRDNWVNLAQRVIEVVLFFHPAVWSLSEWIRLDREYCCDDAVVKHTSNEREDYVRTLASFMIQSPQQGQLLASAMAQTPLLGRIRNILNQKDQTMKMTHKTIIPAIVCFAALNVLGFSVSQSLAEAKTAAQTAAKTGRAGDSVLVKILDSYKGLDSLEASGSMLMEMSAIPVRENASTFEKASAQKTTMRSDFSILLDRSNKLRLEWEQKVHATFSNGGVAWSDGIQHAYTPSFGTDPVTYDSSNMLLAAVQGVSSMLPETARLFQGTASLISPLSESIIVGEETLEGVQCWVVTGKNSVDQNVTLWAAKQDNLIRRYRIVIQPGSIKFPESVTEGLSDKLSEASVQQARAALEMAAKRSITWEATFHDVKTNEKIDDARFAATTSH